MQRRGVFAKNFSCFMRCSRRSFPFVHGVVDEEAHGVTFLNTLQCLRRWLFTYLRRKDFQVRVTAFCSGLFCLALFYAI